MHYFKSHIEHSPGETDCKARRTSLVSKFKRTEIIQGMFYDSKGKKLKTIQKHKKFTSL